jgi:hypothetical protein
MYTRDPLDRRGASSVAAILVGVVLLVLPAGGVSDIDESFSRLFAMAGAIAGALLYVRFAARAKLGRAAISAIIGSTTVGLLTNWPTIPEATAYAVGESLPRGLLHAGGVALLFAASRKPPRRRSGTARNAGASPVRASRGTVATARTPSEPASGTRLAGAERSKVFILSRRGAAAVVMGVAAVVGLVVLQNHSYQGRVNDVREQLWHIDAQLMVGVTKADYENAIARLIVEYRRSAAKLSGVNERRRSWQYLGNAVDTHVAAARSWDSAERDYSGRATHEQRRDFLWRHASWAARGADANLKRTFELMYHVPRSERNRIRYSGIRS